MRVMSIWRFPVASFAGEQCVEAYANWAGLDGDRGLVAVRVSDGMVAAPEKDAGWSGAPLVEATADPLRIRVPNGFWFDTRSSDAENSLSTYFGFRVQVREACAFGKSDPSGQALPLRAPRMALHLITTWQISNLQAALPNSQICVSRFRPNVLLEATEAETKQLQKAPFRLRLGQCVLEILEETVRCGFPALPQPGLHRDGKILKHLRRHHEFKFGFGCKVIEPGQIRVGDPVGL